MLCMYTDLFTYLCVKKILIVSDTYVVKDVRSSDDLVQQCDFSLCKINQLNKRKVKEYKTMWKQNDKSVYNH